MNPGVLSELPLFNYPTAPHNGTETSREAAEAILPEIDTVRRMVLTAFLNAPAGLNSDEGEARTGIPHQTFSARMKDFKPDKCIPPLIRKRINPETGKPERRPTRAGLHRAAKGLTPTKGEVWELTPEALVALRQEAA